MTQLQELKDAIEAQKADLAGLMGQNTVLLAKVDAFVVLGDNIIERLTQLAEGGLLPTDELSALTKAINASRDAIHEIGAADDAASAKLDAATARDQLPPDAAGGTDAGGAETTGTPPADGAASTDGSGQGPQDGTSADNPTPNS